MLAISSQRGRRQRTCNRWMMFHSVLTSDSGICAPFAERVCRAGQST